MNVNVTFTHVTFTHVTFTHVQHMKTDWLSSLNTAQGATAEAEEPHSTPEPQVAAPCSGG